MSQHSLNKISQEAFENLVEIPIIIDAPNSTRFSVLSFNDYKYALSWASELVEAEVLLLEKYNLLLVGIDLAVVGLNINTGSIAFKIGLNNFFSFFKETITGFIIVSETDIIGINGENCSISRFSGVPGIIENVQVKGNKLVVECLEGTYEI